MDLMRCCKLTPVTDCHWLRRERLSFTRGLPDQCDQYQYEHARECNQPLALAASRQGALLTR